MFSITNGSAPSPDIGKDVSGFSVAGESPKPCCSGCLGKDTIAKAAVKVGPSVVSISLQQGNVYIFIVLFEVLAVLF